ncbi:MAG: hypothetical protein H0X39_13805 [Actinobacteria bacterium]|nr:hypothetical protein [Actinomycetota bacterium]
MTDTSPDVADLRLEIAQCEACEDNLEQRLLMLQHHHRAFPDEVTAPQLVELRTRLVEMRRRTSSARARLVVTQPR